MTLPDTITLPIHSERILSGSKEDLHKYLRELIFTLQDMYEDIVFNVNGNIRTNTSQASETYTPIVRDSGNTAITFTYVHQIGFVLRQGLMTDVWVDVEWSNPSAAVSGNLYVQLPYEVANSAEMPFVGVCQPSAFTFTGGTKCVINAIPNTFRGEIWNTGSAFTTANQATVNSGRLIFHVRYIGKQNV